MTTSIDEKLSQLIQDQVPEFVRDTYPIFQTFLEKYYEFNEQNGEVQYNIQKARSFADIDETANAFVDYFIDQYAYNLPNSVFKDQLFLVDSGLVSSTESKRLLAKRLVDYHGSKGSEKGIRLLFRLLFDAEISVYYPKVDILRPSDSEWKPLKTIFLYDPLANVAVSNYSASVVQGLSSGASVVLDSLFSLQFLDGGAIPLYEMKIENDSVVGSFIPGEVVTIKTGNLVTGLLESVANIKFYNAITSIDILDAGTGYQKDTELFLNSVSSIENFYGTISRVGSTGQIKEFSLIKHVNTNNELNFTFTNDIVFSGGLNDFSGEFSLKSNIADIILFDSGNAIFHGMQKGDTINLTFTSGITRASNAFAVNSVISSRKFNVANATMLGGNANIITGAVTLDGRDANLRIQLGAIATYAPEFLNKNSQLSDEKKIQDGDFYQDYSYRITSDQSSYLWKDIIKKSIHPVGYKLFTQVFLVLANGFSASRVEPGGAFTTSLMRIQITNPIGADVPTDGINQIIIESVGRVSRDVYKHRSSGIFYRDFDKWKFYNSSLRIYEIADWTPERVSNNYDKLTEPQIALSVDVYQGGSNVILNSDFSTSSNWALGSGHSIGLSNLNITSSSANTVQQYNADANNKYMATYEIVSSSSGSVALSSNTFVGTSQSAPGNYSEIFWIDSSIANVIISPTAFTGNVSNVFVKKLVRRLG